MEAHCSPESESAVLKNIFKDVKFYLIGKISDKEKIVQLLENGEAKQNSYLTDMVTHVIADNEENPEISEAKELFELPVITSKWVLLSVYCKHRLPAAAFSSENQLFSGVIACPSQLLENDCKIVWSLITYFGGQCQPDLDKNCTHLITTKPSGNKYDYALGNGLQIKLVTPDWVTECVNNKTRQIEEDYHPSLLISDEPVEAESEPSVEEEEPVAEPEIKLSSLQLEPEKTNLILPQEPPSPTTIQPSDSSRPVIQVSSPTLSSSQQHIASPLPREQPIRLYFPNQTVFQPLVSQLAQSSISNRFVQAKPSPSSQFVSASSTQQMIARAQFLSPPLSQLQIMSRSQTPPQSQVLTHYSSPHHMTSSTNQTHSPQAVTQPKQQNPVLRLSPQQSITTPTRAITQPQPLVHSKIQISAIQQFSTSPHGNSQIRIPHNPAQLASHYHSRFTLQNSNHSSRNPQIQHFRVASHPHLGGRPQHLMAQTPQATCQPSLLNQVYSCGQISSSNHPVSSGAQQIQYSNPQQSVIQPHVGGQIYSIPQTVISTPFPCMTNVPFVNQIRTLVQSSIQNKPPALPNSNLSSIQLQPPSRHPPSHIVTQNPIVSQAFVSHSPQSLLVSQASISQTSLLAPVYRSAVSQIPVCRSSQPPLISQTSVGRSPSQSPLITQISISKSPSHSPLVMPGTMCQTPVCQSPVQSPLVSQTPVCQSQSQLQVSVCQSPKAADSSQMYLTPFSSQTILSRVQTQFQSESAKPPHTLQTKTKPVQSLMPNHTFQNSVSHQFLNKTTTTLSLSSPVTPVTFQSCQMAPQVSSTLSSPRQPNPPQSHSSGLQATDCLQAAACNSTQAEHQLGNQTQVTPQTKTALAKLLNTRLQHSGIVPESPEAGQPLSRLQNMINSQQIAGSLPRTLRNITNSSLLQREQATVQFYGQDPNIKVPPDLCLLGCIFLIVDYDRILDNEKLATWKKVILQHGGQVETAYNASCTHVLCENQRNSVVQQAMREGKRCVTAHWLNDCLLQRRMIAPWLALHLPTPFSDDRPCKNQIITVTNFEGGARVHLKHMISTVGAKYTGYMTRNNTLLICKRAEGLKYDKAKEWKMPIVNVQWLNDVLFGHYEALSFPQASKFQQFSTSDCFSVDYALVPHLMASWRTPIKIMPDVWKNFLPNAPLKLQKTSENLLTKRKTNQNIYSTPVKKLRSPSWAPLSSDRKLIILITGFQREESEDLKQKVLQLGGSLTSSAKECSHLVASNLTRTVKFLCAISVCNYIVQPQWIHDSFRLDKFQDESMYPLEDPSAESVYGCELVQSLRRACQTPLFQNMTFYITPGVQPPPVVMKEIIECAGGKLVHNRPSARKILQLNGSGTPCFIVISCENDLHLCKDIISHNIAIYNAEFILTGALRQQLDFQLFRLQAEK